MAEEAGEDSQFLLPQEAQPAESKAGLTVESETAAQVERLACELEAHNRPWGSRARIPFPLIRVRFRLPPMSRRTPGG